jgi:transposase
MLSFTKHHYLGGADMMIVESSQLSTVCPCCQKSTSRVDSNYERTIADLPWQGVDVRLRVRVRRFFCGRHCERVIFCERLPGVVAPYARKSARLEGALRL